MVEHVEVKILPPMTIACVRYVGSYFDTEEAFRTAVSEGKRLGLIGPETIWTSLYYDDPDEVRDIECRTDAGFSLDDPTQETGLLEKRHVRGGLYAEALYSGPYDGLVETYRWICKTWIRQQEGLEIDKSRPSAEIYTCDHTTLSGNTVVIRLPLRARN